MSWVLKDPFVIALSSENAIVKHTSSGTLHVSLLNDYFHSLTGLRATKFLFCTSVTFLTGLNTTVAAT